METKFYSITKEAEYDAMAERLNLLAEALINVHPGAKYSKNKAKNKITREFLQFFRRLI